MDVKMVKLSDDLMVNLATIYSIQRIPINLEEEHQHWEENVSYILNYKTKDYVDKHLNEIDLADEDFMSYLVDTLKTETLRIAGQEPPHYTYQYVVTLNTTKQIGIDVNIYNALTKLVENNK